jgi:hypothetical protein
MQPEPILTTCSSSTSAMNATERTNISKTANAASPWSRGDYLALTQVMALLLPPLIALAKSLYLKCSLGFLIILNMY